MKPSSLFKQDGGQTLMLLALLLVLVVSVTGLAIDLGYAYHAQRQLQASADAASTAGALDLPNSAVSAVSDATLASGLTGDKNAVSTLYSVQMVKGYPLVTCFQPCSATVTTNCVPGVATVPACSYNGTATGNVVVVEETGKSPTFFSKLMGFGSLTINVTSVAMAKGNAPLPINIMMVTDSTESMQGTDSNCGIRAAGAWPFSSSPTEEDCAKWGVRTLLLNLNNAVQNVGLVTFPAVNPSSDKNEYDCWNPQITPGDEGTSCTSTNRTLPYSCPSSDFLVVPLTNDYLSSNGSLASNSDLVGAVYWGGAGQSCTGGSHYGIQDPGGQSTRYGEAITEATGVLQKTPDIASAIIVLGDGTVNTGSSPCSSAVSAARAAAAEGILVYAVGYNIPAGNCGDGGYTYCHVMQDIASSPSNFYGDTVSTKNCCNPASACPNSGLTDLGSIFKGLAATLGNTRLLPSSSYTP